MRLRHYKLIPYLTDSQLKTQWKNLNTIFKNQPNQILINYIYDIILLPDLYRYSIKVILEIKSRGFKIKSLENFEKFFDEFYTFEESKKLGYIEDIRIQPVYKKYHDNSYLRQCFYNLQEKYYRGQKDFSKDRYSVLKAFCEKELNDGSIKD